MSNMHKLVIFDLDGTLIDTLEDLSAAVNHALELRGLPRHSLEEYRGMVELLRDLHAAGVQMAVASNKFQEGTEYLIREFFPEIPFVAILGNRPGWPLKPSPEIVDEVLRASGLPKEEAVMVGDSGTDMQTARNGGINAIAVGWGYRRMEPSDDRAFAGSMTELRTLLLGRVF